MVWNIRSERTHLQQKTSAPVAGLRLLASGIFIFLLFVQHFRTNPSYWGNYPKSDYNSLAGARLLVGFGAMAAELGILLTYPGVSANMIADILLTGPRLICGTFGLIRRGFRTKNLDESNCATFMSILHSRIHVVSYEELKETGWEPYLNQMHCIDGVEFLQKGLFLSEELRCELNNLPSE